MKRIFIWFAATLFLLATPALAETAKPRVELDTTMGTIVLELEPDKAPKTVANFLQYVEDGFYTNTIFHRVIDEFMIQGGGFNPDYTRKETRPPILNEADNGLQNKPGTIAMARTMDPHSATSQFFINVVDNDYLNHTDKTPRGWGYTVFGQVVGGMNVVNKIKAVPTGPGGPFPKDVPRTPIIIKSAKVVK